ncbi:alkaline phosphatase family protein [Metallosphaera javensis (ex Sakai et al. 2022)]|uniref:alkaline phosphatase family protein n=1 Tax=Metallosphaera javensis (ex Sakai et al. 2022) TaxID=2775498 RepID=UPI002586CCFD|nr:MAG: putative non-hemolytic phospholipase C [Metallosphaera javensis (ex Sakai et al. 2022)]
MRWAILLLLILIPALISEIQVRGQSTVTPIQHVIIVIDENHSFDNLFGVYPFGVPPIINNVTCSVMRPVNLEESPGILRDVRVPLVPGLPWYTSPFYINSSTPPDPQEGYQTYHWDYWYGTEQGFPLFSGSQSMGYFSYEQVGILWDYAEEYVLFDNYYSPVLDVTEPNRIAYLLGFPPSFHNDESSGIYSFNQSIMYQLTLHNMSWGYFVYDLQGIPWPVSTLRGVPDSNFYNLSVFYEDLKDGNLPSVSWVMFLGGSSDRYDMHPPHNVTAGAIAFSQVVNAVMRSEYWNSTAILFTFDEGGGYYDQVTPPYVNGTSLGQRIPLLLISPYAKEGYVDNYTVSGYTLLAFIDYNWRLPWLTSWVENSDLQGFLQAFNFSTARPPLILTPGNWTYPVPLQYPVKYGYVATVDHPVDNLLYSFPSEDLILPVVILILVALAVVVKRRRGP